MQEDIKIRKVKTSDIKRILDIVKRTAEFNIKKEGSLFWTEKQLRQWAKSKKDIMLLAEHKKGVVGFVFFTHHIPTGKVTWENAWVSPKMRGMGIVQELYKKAEECLKRKGSLYICSMTKPSSKASIAMQKKMGFEEQLKFIWMDKSI